MPEMTAGHVVTIAVCAVQGRDGLLDGKGSDCIAH
jgi:hypothetical protein